MPDTRVRFTTWLTDEEDRRLRQAAKDHGVSVNSLVRMAVRQVLGLPNMAQMSQLSQVTKKGHK